jgi:hypothetical protein
MSTVGRNAILVRRVLINLHFTWSRPTSLMDIRWILRDRWGQRENIISISFVEWAPDTPLCCRVMASGPNRMLAALSPSASPQLTAYIRSEESLYAAHLKRDGSVLKLLLGTRAHSECQWMPVMRYKLSDTGQLVRTESRKATPDLVGIWRHTPIRNQLLALLPFPKRAVTYDLTRNTTSQALPSIFHANRSLRDLAIESLGHGRWRERWREKGPVAFGAQMHTQSQRATFGRFEALGDWVVHGRPRPFDDSDMSQPRGPWRKAPSISLIFHVKDLSSLGDVLFEVTDLVFRTFALQLETTICARVALNVENSAPVQQSFSKLFRLRRTLLVFLADLLLSHPRLQLGPCPRVWIDSKFCLRGAEFRTTDGTTKTVVNEKYKYTTSQLNKAKEAAFQRLAPGTIDENWGRDPRHIHGYGWIEEPATPDPDAHEALLSCATFLARFIKQRKHPEVDKVGLRDWQYKGRRMMRREGAMISYNGYNDRYYRDSSERANECAPWKELRPLRPREL